MDRTAWSGKVDVAGCLNSDRDLCLKEGLGKTPWTCATIPSTSSCATARKNSSPSATTTARSRRSPRAKQASAASSGPNSHSSAGSACRSRRRTAAPAAARSSSPSSWRRSAGTWSSSPIWRRWCSAAEPRALLPAVIEGHCCLAFAHDDHGVPTRAERRRDGYVLQGGKKLVLGGAMAETLLVSARLDD